jgi:hypothetical protein
MVIFFRCRLLLCGVRGNGCKCFVDALSIGPKPNLEQSTTEEGAADVAAFVSIFFENFSKFKGRAFHMAGESYGGRYIPVFAAAVYDQNAALVQAGITPINLTSVMIGRCRCFAHLAGSDQEYRQRDYRYGDHDTVVL